MTTEQSILRTLRVTPDLSATQLAERLRQWRGTVTLALLQLEATGALSSRESDDGRLYRTRGRA